MADNGGQPRPPAPKRRPENPPDQAPDEEENPFFPSRNNPRQELIDAIATLTVAELLELMDALALRLGLGTNGLTHVNGNGSSLSADDADDETDQVANET